MNQNIIFPISKEENSNSSFIKTVELKYYQYKVFLDEDIEDPANYRELIDLFFSAQENDEIQIYINSSGGQLRTALAIIEGIKITRASVIGIIIGNCHSAASLIALHCHNIIVLDSASMMIHTAWATSDGTVSNIQTYTSFLRNQVEKLLHQTYEGFLTSNEIEKVKMGLEIWLDAEEIRRRINNRTKLLEKKEIKHKITNQQVKKATKKIEESRHLEN